MSFDEDAEELRVRFPDADLVAGGNVEGWDVESGEVERGEAFRVLCAKVAAAIEAPGTGGDIPLDIQGTAFQQRVWQELRCIPPGETLSYGELAARIGKPKASRAVGSANGANAIAVLIPCHRVVHADGSLGGYAYGSEIKRELLRRERQV